MIRGAWHETVVVLLIEFGRTARINGTDGTDHGTSTVMPLAGGALEGGRVRRLAWPKIGGLVREAHLKPTIDVGRRSRVRGRRVSWQGDVRAMAGSVASG